MDIQGGFANRPHRRSVGGRSSPPYHSHQYMVRVLVKCLAPCLRENDFVYINPTMLRFV